MLRVTCSNQFEALCDGLADDLESARRAGVVDLFTPAAIVVPNGLVASAVRLALARRTGIAANLGFAFFEGMLGGLIERARPGWRALDSRLLQSLLLGVLADGDRLAGDALTPVRDYVGDGPVAEIRRVQLSGELARLFIDYTLTRPEMVREWMRAAAAGRDDEPASARWQRRLWHEVFGAGGAAERAAGAGGRLAPLAFLFEEVPAAELAPPRIVHVFGFSYLARGYRPILGRLAGVCEVRLYSPSPCREFWDDVAGRGAEGAGEDPAPLVLWGRPGREHAALLNDMTEGDLIDRYVDRCAPGRAPTALARLQRDILDRRAAPGGGSRGGLGGSGGGGGGGAGGDDSVRVLACPSAVRELEIIGGEIARMLDVDRSLRMADVAVLVTPARCERYQAQAVAVFEPFGLSCRLADRPLAGESRAPEAVDALLDLPLGRFTRPELLGLLVHPAVLARCPEVDRDDWIRWCDELGIVHGADLRDHRGTYIADDLFNWDQGLRRLALGSFMDTGGGGRPPAVKLGGQTYLAARLAPDERHSAARFALLARTLIDEARAIRLTEQPLARWADHLDRLVADQLAAAGPADEHALDRCREVIRGLAAADLDGRAVGYAVARELLREPLGALRAAGEVATDAILIAPLAPMRPLPFRALFVAGLDGGCFPAADRESGFDVRAGRPRRAGDVSRRDRDRYSFLEALMSARDRLVVSYVARDEETGEALEPSSLVHELVDMVADGYLRGTDGARLVVRPPLRRWEAPGPGDPVGRRLAACAALRRSAVEHCTAAGAAAPVEEELARELARPERSALARALGMPVVVPAPPLENRTGRSEAITLPLSAVRRFLECPLQAWASAVLRVRAADEDDRVARRDEPFEQGLLSLTASLRAVFVAQLAAGGAADAGALRRLYRTELAREQQAGRAPTGAFASGAERRCVRTLERWRCALEEVVGGRPLQATEIIGFGGVREDEAVARIEPAIEIAAAGGPVRLVGSTQLLGGAGVGSLVLVAGDEWSARHWVRGAFDAVVLAAAGLADGRAGEMTIVTGAGRSARFRFGAIAREEALGWLSARVDEMFGAPHDYFLPCEIALPYARGQRSGGLAADAAQLLAGRGFHSAAVGPLRLPRRIGLPPHAGAVIQQRFGIWIDRMEVVG